MDNDFEIIVKGAMLHDIGKLIRRTKEKPFDKSKGEWGYEWLKNKLKESDKVINSAIIANSEDEKLLQSNSDIIWYESNRLATPVEEQKSDKDIFTPLVSPFIKIRNPNNLKDFPELSYVPLKSSESIYSVSFKKLEINRKDYEKILMDLENDLAITEEYRPYSINLLLMLF